MPTYTLPRIDLPLTHGAFRYKVNENFNTVAAALNAIDARTTANALTPERIAQLEGKQDKEKGKGLSTNDFTNDEKDELRRLGNASKKLILNRSIPTKARKGERYFFADGIVKIKVRTNDPRKEEIENRLRSQGAQELYNDATISVWGNNDLQPGAPVIAVVNSYSKKVSYSDLVIKKVGNQFSSHNTASPYLCVEKGVVRGKRVTTAVEIENALNEAVVDISADGLDDNTHEYWAAFWKMLRARGYKIQRLKNCIFRDRKDPKNPNYRRKKKIWKTLRKSLNVYNLRIRVERFHRQKKSSTPCELLLFRRKGKFRLA